MPKPHYLDAGKHVSDKAHLKNLHEAIVKGNMEKVKQLAKQVGDKDRETWKLGLHSPVHSAAGFGKVAALEYLLDELNFPVDCYIYDHNYSITPIQWAAFHKQKATVRMLLDRGADLKVKGYWYSVSGTALQIAKERNCQEIASMIKKEWDRRKASKTSNNNEVKDKTSTQKETPHVPSSTFEARTGLVVCETTVDANSESEEEEENFDTTNAGVTFDVGKEENSLASSTVSSATHASECADSNNSLMREITKAIRAKKKEVIQELSRAELVDAEIAALEAKIRKLRAPNGHYRSEEQKGDLESELDVLDGKMERVREASRLAGETFLVDEDQDNLETTRCTNCLREPVGRIHECVKCDGMLCALCLVGSDRCQVCQADLEEAPPRRHRLAERKVRKKQALEGPDIYV